jgi:hypothetical protein
VTLGDDGPDVPRFWCPIGGFYAVDADGYLAGTRNHDGLAPVLATSELSIHRGLVLLGEPGAGKTRTIAAHSPFLPSTARAVRVASFDLGLYGSEERVVASLLEGAEVRRWLECDEELCLVLDSFDEAQARIPTLARLFSHYLGQWPADRLHLRIACRTAEWPESLADAMRKVFTEAGEFELLPLRKIDVGAFLPHGGSDTAFLGAVSQAHAVPLAARPLTLKLLVRLFIQAGGFPDRVADLYARGLLSLCDEQDVSRRDARAVGVLPPTARLAVARRIAAVSVFGGCPVIWTGPLTQDADAPHVSADECGGGVEHWDELEVELTPGAVKESLQTGLFNGRGAQQLGWAHASFADYLAADWVISNDLAQEQIRSLFFAADGHMYPQLRTAAAWMVAIAPDACGWMTKEDPESFLGQVSLPDASLREAALDGALRAAAEDRLQDAFSTRYRDLAHAGLAGQLRPYLRHEHPGVRRLAIRVAEHCAAEDLVPDLLAIALDPAADAGGRVTAGWAVKTITPGTSALLPLVTDTAVLGDDPDDEILGLALLASWPHALSTAEALASCRLPRRRSLLGLYRHFLENLAAELGEDDLVPACHWLVAAGSDGDDQLLAGLTDKVLRLMAAHLDDAVVFQGLREVALRRARNRRALLLRGLGREALDLPERDRRRLALSLADEGPGLALAMTSQAHGLGLVGPADLSWLIGQYAEQPRRRPALAQLFQLSYRLSDPVHVNAVLELPEDHPLVVDVVSDWRRPVRLDSDQAREMREQWQLLNAYELPEQEADDGGINQRIALHVDAALAGDPAGFWLATRLVTVRPGTVHYMSEFQPDLTAHLRWEQLDQGIRDRMLQAAELYLQTGQCAPEEWLGKEVVFFPAQAGYRALLLLARLAPTALDGLQPQVWQEWAPAIIDWLVTINGASWDDKLPLLQRARVHADGGLRDALVKVIRGHAGRGEHVAMRSPECRELWCRELSDELLSVAAEETLPLVTRDDLLDIIVSNDPGRARVLLRSWLEPEQASRNRDRAKLATALLLLNDGAASWPAIHQVLVNDPELGKEALLSAVSRDDSALRDLQAHQLADLYCWIGQHFPVAQEPREDKARYTGPPVEVKQWRDAIPNILAKEGSAEAVEAIRRIAEAFPAEPWLRLRLAEAAVARRAAQWAPVPPGQLRRLAADRRARLVRSAEELLRVTVKGLDAIQQRLQGDTPEAHLLWDTRVRRPKTEEEASDYLQQRLNDLIGPRGAVVNREVQVRRNRPAGIPERTDLRIDATAADPGTAEAPVITVVGEVKAAWNADLITAMSSQLAGRYMLDTGTTHGLYVVLWFDTGWWSPTQGASDRNRVARLDRAQVLQDLRQEATALAADGYTIEVVMLNMSYERPDPANW